MSQPLITKIIIKTDLIIHWKKNRGKRYRTKALWLFCFFLELTLLVGSHLLCSCPISLAATEELTNNKIFTHNRSTYAYDTDGTFFTRLRDLSAKRKPDYTINTKTNGEMMKYIGGRKTKSNVSSMYQHGTRPSYPGNPNYNHYASSHSITRSPSKTGIFLVPSLPRPTHAYLYPKYEMKSEHELQVQNHGRSSSDDILRDDDRIGELNSYKASDADFFKNFRDHAEDPMAEESGGPLPSYTRSDFPMSSVSATGSAPMILTGSSQFDHSNDEQYEAMSNYPARYEMSAYDHNSYLDHKNLNYWPKKLHSYYEDDHFTNSDFSQLHPKRTHFFNSGSGTNPDLTNFGYEVEDANTNIIHKVSMIDRVSTLYTDYKIIAWAGILVLAFTVILFALFTLYLKNPPTEVVTARKYLKSQLTDAGFSIFLYEALMKFEDKNIQSIKTISQRKKNKHQNMWRREKFRNSGHT